MAAAGSVYRLKQLYDEAAGLGPRSPFNRMLSNVHLGTGTIFCQADEETPVLNFILWRSNF